MQTNLTLIYNKYTDSDGERGRKKKHPLGIFLFAREGLLTWKIGNVMDRNSQAQNLEQQIFVRRYLEKRYDTISYTTCTYVS